jgi:Outer membrane protein beta-barrel domain
MTDLNQNTNNEFTPEMEYQDAYWQDALSKLEAAERAIRQKRRKKVGFGFTLLFIVGFSVAKLTSFYEKKDHAFIEPQKIDSDLRDESKIQLKDSENKSNSPESVKVEVPAQLNRGPKKQQSQNIPPDRNIIVTSNQTIQLININSDNDFKIKEIQDSANGSTMDRDSATEFQTEETSNDINSIVAMENEVDSDPQLPLQISAEHQSDLSNNEGSEIYLAKEMAEVSPLNPLYYTFPERINPSPLKLALPMKPGDLDPTWRISVQMGSNLLSGYSTTKNELAWEPFGGLLLSRKINPKFSIGSGIRYFQISQPLQTLSQDYISLGFKREISTVVVYTDKLHYIDVPISLFYNLNNKHRIVATFQTAYQLTGDNRLVTSNPDGSTIEAKDRGYTNGFRDFNYSIGLGYEYRIRRGKSIGFNANLGLTDITKNEYFNVNRFDRNSFVGLYLKFDLFSK